MMVCLMKLIVIVETLYISSEEILKWYVVLALHGELLLDVQRSFLRLEGLLLSWFGA
jgi:hypothetical protein